MVGLPTGTLTFLFTDIEGSTKRWEAHPEAMRVALARHDAILRGAIEREGGYVFKTVGDAFCAAFSTPHFALQAALQAQSALHSERWDDMIGAVRVRMALHTGVAEERDGDYFGQPLNRVVRILSAGHGGQTLLSNATYDLVRDALPASVQILGLGAHSLKDLIRPENIFQLAIPGLPSQFPPLKTLDNRPNNLPRQPTPLIGRELDIDKIGTLLRGEHAILVTLTGPGGTGKTRLGLQVAAEMLDDFEDGVWFVDLSPLVDSGLVISTIAQTLVVRETSGEPLADVLKAYLKEKQLLLVLDNFEQVAGAASQVGDLALSSQRVKVLVTSRVPLRIQGVKEYPVSPLSLPDYRHLPSLANLTQYEAVRLFIERATDINPDFEVNNDNAPTVAEICVRLDGLPLAIELAAARTRLFPPQALLARLSDRLKLLTGGAHNVPARQRTLLKTMEWSYDLLSQGEQQLFRRMAVFQGGRTLEALEAVCNFDGQLEADLLEGTEGLVEASLLQQRQGSGGEARFWMLETVHEYARRRLEESGAGETLRRQHAFYFMDMAEEAEPQERGPRIVEWLDWLEEQHDNFRAALRWAIDNGHADVALAICGCIGEFWIRRGYHTEGWDWISASLALAHVPERSTGPPVASAKAHRARALLRASRLAGRRSDSTSARSLAEQSLALYTELGDKSGMAQALINRSTEDQTMWTGLQWSNMQETAKLATEAGDRSALASAFYYLGDIAMGRGDTAMAHTNYSKALDLLRRTGGKPLTALTLIKLGGIARSAGEYDTALALYEESLDIYRQLRDRWSSTYALGNLGALAHLQGYDARARAIFEETLELAREFGFKIILAAMLGNLGALHLSYCDYKAVRPLLEESLAISNDIGDDTGASQQQYLLGKLAQDEGDSQAAEALFTRSLRLAAHGVIQLGYNYAIHELVACLSGLASIRLSRAEVKTATTLLGASDALRNSLPGRYEMEGVVQSSIDRSEHERTVAATHALLDDVNWEAAWELGQAMTVEQAVAYALEDDGNV